MVQIQFKGFLGNQLFQFAAGLSLALDNNDKISYSKWDHLAKILGAEQIKELTNNTPFAATQKYTEPFFHFVPIPYKHNMMLDGYFQSEKYWMPNKQDIVLYFQPNPGIRELLNEKFHDQLYEKITCSIHVRRGDYVNLPDHHPLQPMEYYYKAIEHIGKSVRYMIFSDDIAWCKANFDPLHFSSVHTLDFVFMEGNQPYEDLFLQSMCTHNIICNSSFSWWGAYLNLNAVKIVIAPKLWFGSAYKLHNTRDLYCPGWIKM